jgi:hypothetical protein
MSNLEQKLIFRKQNLYLEFPALRMLLVSSCQVKGSHIPALLHHLFNQALISSIANLQYGCAMLCSMLHGQLFLQPHTERIPFVIQIASLTS